MTPSPSLAVVVVAYDRPGYLRELLTSLLAQDSSNPFEFVLLDNGSSPPLEAQVADLLAALPGRVIVLREENNLLTPVRWTTAVNACTSDFVLLPGDDDVLEPHYLSTVETLLRTTPEATMVSMGMREIDQEGNLLGRLWRPPDYPSQPTALACLLNSDPYPMPASGFRRTAVELANAPLTRSAFDWWLWIQCWMGGPATVSQRETVKYRQHAGQEQRSYGVQTVRLDAARMLLAVVMSERFGSTLDSWSQSQLNEFIDAVLSTSGPGNGDSRWGPIIQMVLADRVARRASQESLAALYAQASGQAGVPAHEGATKTLVGGELPAGSQVWAWSRVPVGSEWQSECAFSEKWRAYLALPETSGADIRMTTRCSCVSSESGSVHRLQVSVARFDELEQVHLVIDTPPEPSSAAPVLDALGRMTGREHGFESASSADDRFLRAFRRFRFSRAGAFAERSARRAKRLLS